MPKIRIVKKEVKEVTPPNNRRLTEEQRNIWSDFAEANPNLTFEEKFVFFNKKNPNSGIDKNVLRESLDKYKYNLTRSENEKIARSEPYFLNKSPFGEKQLINTGDSFLKVFDDRGKFVGRHDEYGNIQGGGGFTPTRIIPKNEISIDIDPSTLEFEGGRYVRYKNPQSGDLEYAKIDDVLNNPKYQNRTKELMRNVFEKIDKAARQKDLDYEKYKSSFKGGILKK